MKKDRKSNSEITSVLNMIRNTLSRQRKKIRARMT